MIATFIILAILTIELGASLSAEILREGRTSKYVSSVIVYVLDLVLFYYAGLFDKFIH